MIIISKKQDGKGNPKWFEIYRLNIQDMEKTAKFSLTKSGLEKDKITIRSSEIVRIVTAFNPDNLRTDGSEYAFIKDLVILKIGRSYNKYYDRLCRDKSPREMGVFTLEILDIDKDKNTTVLESIRYKRLLCGSSFVRNTKELYIREELHDVAMKVLLTGIPQEARFPIDKTAKYSTYLGLAATDSKAVSMPRICVVDDYKKKIKDAFDKVEKVEESDGSFSYEVINFVDSKLETEEVVNCFDGAGIVSYERASQWAKELGLDYVPSSFQIRVLNGIKGNLYTFPLTEYIQYLEDNGLTDSLTTQDLWGTSINIRERNIDVILTKSQFKFADMYENFERWRTAFDTVERYNGFEYRRTFNISDVSVDIKKLNDEVWSAYQPLQTLSLSHDEIVKLSEPTVDLVKMIYTNMDEFLKYRGISADCDFEESGEEQYRLGNDKQIPWYYKALALDSSLQFDPYIKKKIEYDIQSLVKRIYMGKIILKGNYQTAIPDLLALAEHIFNQPVVGALKKGEIYSNYWNTKTSEKVSIWRNPHIACEWFNATVVKNAKTDLWFKYQNTGIVTDIYGTLPLRLGTMDFDGDTVASISSDIIYDAIERADIHTIRVVNKDLNKSTNEESFCIGDFEPIMYTNKLGFQNNIGDVTNKVTILWGAFGDAEECDEKKKISNYIKIMSVINEMIIDFVKTGIKVPIPAEIMGKVSKLKKPAFLKYKHRAYVKDAKISQNAEKYDFALKCQNDKIDRVIRDQQQYQLSGNTVDRIFVHLEGCIKDIENTFANKKGECFFTKLLQQIPYIYNVKYPLVKKKIIELQEAHNTICGKKYYDEKEGYSSDDSSWRFARFYSYCEVQLLAICTNRQKLLQYLIYAYYADADLCNADKSILWNVFGQDIYKMYLDKEYIDRADCNAEEQKILRKLEKKVEKAKKQADEIKKMCSNAGLVKIKSLPKNEIVITDTELNYISEKLRNDKEAQQLAVALLAVYRKINADAQSGKKRTKVIRVTKGKKNEITESQLCKLANIYHNQYKNRLEKLHRNMIIEISMDNLAVPKIKVEVPEMEKSEKEYRITDINDVRVNIIDVKYA